MCCCCGCLFELVDFFVELTVVVEYKEVFV